MEMEIKLLDNPHLKRQTVAKFWTAVIFSFGFYLIYYYKVKNECLRLKKMLGMKIKNVRNICISLNNDVFQLCQQHFIDPLWFDASQENICLFDYNHVLSCLHSFYVVHQALFEKDSNLKNNLHRLTILERQINTLASYFNQMLFKFPVTYVAYQHHFEPIMMVKSYLNKDLVA